MQYRSVSDLNEAIVSNLALIPRDIDLVVGVPRSGLLAANLLSLALNVPMSDLDSFLDGREYTSGSTKPVRRFTDQSRRRKILLLDDSISSGKAMREARARIDRARVDADIVFAAVYGIRDQHPEADLVLEKVDLPRLFQWNFMHHKILEQACVDIDGVLCLDPSEDENDDGAAYLEFLKNAVPYHATTRKIGWLVTSRLEKYRPQTEAWLANAGIAYDNLIMLDLASKQERQKLGVHGSFKAEFYRHCASPLFIESDVRQAEVIAAKSGKQVLCIETHQMHLPDPLSAGQIARRFRHLPTRLKMALHETRLQQKNTVHRIVGDSTWDRLKKMRANFDA
jgi:uncharacterized HAD superfamily protein/adenine/guanine phosphoribosyltransferase-like PRPP-binding protein